MGSVPRTFTTVGVMLLLGLGVSRSPCGLVARDGVTISIAMAEEFADEAEPTGAARAAETEREILDHKAPNTQRGTDDVPNTLGSDAFIDQEPQGSPAQMQAERDDGLKNGLTFHDVLRRLGAPTERKEMEARRETVWMYPTRQVFFKEGRVVAWTSRAGGVQSNQALIRSPAVSPQVSSSSSDSNGPREAPDDETIRLILGEIINGPEDQKVEK